MRSIVFFGTPPLGAGPSAETIRREFVGPVGLYQGRSPVVTSGFRTEDRPDHKGVDLLLPLLPEDGLVRPPNTDGKGRWWFPSGRSALAISDGTVLSSLDGPDGAYIKIQHRYGITSQYFHLTKRFAQKGATVYKGQPIGIIGMGRSHLIHLHFQMIVGEGLVDPERYLRYMPVIRDPRDPNYTKWLAVTIGASAATGLLGYWLYKTRRWPFRRV